MTRSSRISILAGLAQVGRHRYDTIQLMGAFDDVIDAGRNANLAAHEAAEAKKRLAAQIAEELYQAITRYAPDFADAAKKSGLPTYSRWTASGTSILHIFSSSNAPGWTVSFDSPGFPYPDTVFERMFTFFIRTTGQVYWDYGGDGWVLLQKGRILEKLNGYMDVIRRKVQLLDGSSVSIRDAPDHPWRTIDDYVRTVFRNHLASLK